MSTACGRPQGEGVWLMWTGVKNPISFGRHKWMASYCPFSFPILSCSA